MPFRSKKDQHLHIMQGHLTSLVECLKDAKADGIEIRLQQQDNNTWTVEVTEHINKRSEFVLQFFIRQDYT